MATAALLVDLDGTVWDSAAWYAEIITAATGQPFLRVTQALRTKPVARVMTDLGVSRSAFSRLCLDAIETLVVFDGVRETLARLLARGTATGAVTNLPGWVAVPMLRSTGLQDLFTVVIDYGKTRRHKPAPDPLLAALTELGVPPTRDSWYIGDTVADAEAARAAGISFVWAGYAPPASPPNEMDAIAASFNEVEGVFE